MINDVESPNVMLSDVVTRIVDAVHPWRVVLFGSRARGTAREDSDYDFYVEVDDTGTTLRALHHELWDALQGSGLTYDLKVKVPGTIEQRRDDPGTIEWDVAREGLILYADPRASREIRPVLRVSEPRHDEPHSVQEWLKVANEDLRLLEIARTLTGDRTIPEDFSPQICEFSQRVCEKYMKALLVSRWARPARTHNLAELLLALRRTGCPLPGLDADCTLLTPYAVYPRYPGSDYGPGEARAAYAAAMRIIAAVRAELPASLH